MEGRAREVLRRLMDAVPGARRFYDVNLRRGCYTPELVRELLSLADAVKLNDDEAELFPDLGEAPSVAVTRGERGCAVRIGNDRAECPGYTVKVVDTVGAGDAFAAAFLHGLAAGGARRRRVISPTGWARWWPRGRGRCRSGRRGSWGCVAFRARRGARRSGWDCRARRTPHCAWRRSFSPAPRPNSRHRRQRPAAPLFSQILMTRPMVVVKMRLGFPSTGGRSCSPRGEEVSGWVGRRGRVHSHQHLAHDEAGCRPRAR